MTCWLLVDTSCFSTIVFEAIERKFSAVRSIYQNRITINKERHDIGVLVPHAPSQTVTRKYTHFLSFKRLLLYTTHMESNGVIQYIIVAFASLSCERKVKFPWKYNSFHLGRRFLLLDLSNILKANKKKPFLLLDISWRCLTSYIKTVRHEPASQVLQHNTIKHFTPSFIQCPIQQSYLKCIDFEHYGGEVRNTHFVVTDSCLREFF